MRAKVELRVLGEKGVERIYKEALKILENVGMRVDDADLRNALIKNGARADTSNRVRLPQKMVGDAIAQVNRKPIIRCINGKELHPYGKNQYCASLTTDPWIIDYKEGPRKPCLSDIERHARLGDALPCIDMLTRMDHSCTDVPDSIVNLKTIEALVTNTTKSLFCAPADIDSAHLWVEVAEILAGGSLHKDPILVGYVATISPLVMPAKYGEILRYLVKKGVIMRGGPCPLSGATSPFSLAGTLALSEAEMLFYIVAVETLSPGAPCFYSVGGYTMDMVSGVFSSAGIDGWVLGVAYAEMATFHNFPTLAGITTTDVPHYDFQNGVESSIGAFLSFFGGGNMLFGLGSLSNASGMSSEQIILHHDLVEAFQRLLQGMNMSFLEAAIQSIERVGPGGNFLEDKETLKLLRSGEHFYGGSFIRANPGPLKKAMLKRAHERVEDILAKHRAAVDPDKIGKVQEYIQDRLREYQRR